MKNAIIILVIGLFSLAPSMLHAQDTPAPDIVFPYTNRISLQTGLLQDLFLSGQNLVVSYNLNRFVFDYSHGNSLDFKSGSHVGGNGSYNDQKLNVHTPWSTGPSFGYRITPYLNVRAEFKAHRYEVVNASNNTAVTAYTAYTIGAGVFYEWYPFQSQSNWLQGILIEPVVRYWPNVGSTLKDNFQYNNPATRRTETLSAYKLGLLANINIGYTFGGK